MKTKFTQSDIKKIKDAQALIQDLQKKQLMAYDVLLLNLPDVNKSEKSLLWDYIFNNQTMTISLDESGLKLESIFLEEVHFIPKPVPDFESDVDPKKTKEDGEKAFLEFRKERERSRGNYD